MTPFHLTPSARAELTRFMHTTHDTRALKRAQALVWLDAGETVTAVAHRLLISRQTVYSWMAMYTQRHDEPLAQRLADRPRKRPGQGPVWVAARTAIAAVIDQSPRTYGYDVPLWSTPLLQAYLQRQGVRTSTRYIRRILRALRYCHKRPRYRLARQSPTWRQAKGGSSAA